MIRKRINSRIKGSGKLLKPLVIAGANIPTLGFAGAIIKILELPHIENQKKKVVEFIKRTEPKIKSLEKKVGKEEFYKRIKSEKFYQLIIEIMRNIQTETREKIKEAYSNVLVTLLREDLKINFDKKLFLTKLLNLLNEDHIKLLHIFYHQKGSRFDLLTIHKKMDCFDYRKSRPGETIPLSGIGSKSLYLNSIRASYVNSLLADLVSKEIIKKYQEIKTDADFKDGDVLSAKNLNDLKSKIEEDYIGTELGREFFDLLKDKKLN